MKLKCKNPKCLYEWEYNGKANFYTSCPRCLNKVKTRKEVKNDKGKESRY